MSVIVAKQRHATSEPWVKKALPDADMCDSRNISGSSASNAEALGCDDSSTAFSEPTFHRVQTREILFERSDFQFRFASDHGRRNGSSALIQRMYAWRGYKCDGQSRADAADEVTLQACRNEHVFGTLTVRFDTAEGLAADALYRAEIDAFRRNGAEVCELTGLAVDPEYGSKEVLGALFHLAYIQFAIMRAQSDIFIEVNPRHVAFYRRMLHFRQVGECRTCPRVDAPAVLLHIRVSYVAEQIAKYGGQPQQSARSLYPYFFSSAEEEGIARRLDGDGCSRAAAALSGSAQRRDAGTRIVNI